MTRSRAKRVVVFNHKGGVGKTTMTLNLAAALARMKRRVLLVDADPQCNLTTYLIASDVVDDLLDHSDDEDGQTLWSAVRPVHDALGDVNVIQPFESGLKGLYILPGDIRLSEFENDLADFWTECFQRKLRGFRGTNALSSLISAVPGANHFDYVFYDVGPSVGPLSRVVMLDCDYFIVPVACDLFSLRALKTLGYTLVDWVQQWTGISSLAPADAAILPGRPVFLGFVPQGFRVYRGIAHKQAQYLSRIEKEIYAQIVKPLRDIDPALAEGTMSELRLGQVQHFGALAPTSQEEGVPMFETHGGVGYMKELAFEAYSGIAKRIDSRLYGTPADG